MENDPQDCTALAGWWQPSPGAIGHWFPKHGKNSLCGVWFGIVNDATPIKRPRAVRLCRSCKRRKRGV